MEFAWDENKRLNNIEKHGIDFVRAQQLFDKPHLIERLPYVDEPRWMAIGILQEHVVAVVFTKRDHAIRLISARRANQYERRKYQTLRQAAA